MAERRDLHAVFAVVDDTDRARTSTSPLVNEVCTVPVMTHAPHRRPGRACVIGLGII